MLDLYEFKMALFENGDPEEFLLIVGNFQISLKASGTLASGANIQYLGTLVRGKALRHLDTFSGELVSTTSENLKSIIFGLCIYFFPFNVLSKKSAR